ncbi:MAG: M1 family metallopeptidase [Kineosporiaceae bacterium]|nr:M1 family metallopeptidase [Kineosporiaceae bacterium]
MNRSREYVPGHGDTRYAVRRYDLELVYKVGTNHLSGTATLSVRALEPLRELAVDLIGLHAGKVLVNGKPAARHTHRGGHLVIRLREQRPAGSEFEVRIDYSGKPKPSPGLHGAAGWEELTDGVLVGSQPYGAPSWFPCNDRADDKASYRVSLTTAEAYHVVGNGDLVARRKRAGSVTWVYEQAEPTSTYLVCVQIGRSTVTELGPVKAAGAKIPVEIVHPRRVKVGSGTAFARQAQMLTTFADLFGPYPFGRYRAVITEDELEIPLEAQGMSSFGANHAVAGWENERLVAHELAHQWFGNSLTAAHWRDIWLHEGFACYSEWLWSQASGGPSTDKHARNHHARLAKLPQDLLLADPGPKLMFDDRVYKRGALTLHALRLAMGERDFFDALRSWTAAKRYGLVDTAGFLKHLDRAAKGSTPSEVADRWLNQRKLPELPS